MHSYKRHVICALLLLIGMSACDRTVDFVPPSDNDSDLPSAIFQVNEVVISEFQVQATVGDTLKLEDSTSYAPTILIIPENLCVYGNGEPCEGELDVQLIQAFTQSDMIFSDIPTTTKKVPLESGGAFYLNITQGGEQLYVRPEALFKIQSSVERTSGERDKMMFYRLDEISDDVYDWRLQGPLADVDSTYYTIEFNELDRWMNIDYEIDTPVKELTVNLSMEGATVSDAQVFLSLEDYNSVGKAEFQESVNNYQGFAPVGTDLQVVALRKDEEQWYLGTRKMDSSADNLDLVLEPASYQLVVATLKNL